MKGCEGADKPNVTVEKAHVSESLGAKAEDAMKNAVRASKTHVELNRKRLIAALKAATPAG